MSEPNYHGYNAFLEDANRREMSNSETYDNALLTLSSALLGLSVTFADKLVPLSNAAALCLLFSSWAALTFTIILTIYSFIYAQGAIRKLKKGARRYYLEGEKEGNSESEAISDRIYLLNSAAGAVFIAGVVLLIVYVSFNVYRESKMPDKHQAVEVPLNKSLPPPIYEQTPVLPPQQPPVQPPLQQPETPTKPQQPTQGADVPNDG